MGMHADAVARALIPALRGMPGLADLSVGGTLREVTQGAVLCSALGTLSQLTALSRLDASANLLDRAALTPLLTVLPFFPALASLDLSPCQAVTSVAFEPAALSAVLSISAACPKLTRLELRGCFLPSTDTFIEDFSCFNAMPEGLSTLRHIDISFSGPGPWAALVAAAQPETLIMDGCNSALHIKPDPGMLPGLVDIVSSAAPRLAALRIARCALRSTILDDVIACVPAATLTALDLSHSAMTPPLTHSEGEHLPMEELAQLTNLCDIRITGHWPQASERSYGWAATPFGLAHIGKLTNLTRLDLSCQVNLGRIPQLLFAGILSGLPALADLSLAFTNLGYEGVLHLVEALKVASARGEPCGYGVLARLDVRGCALDDHAAAVLMLQLTRSVPTLEMLDMSLNLHSSAAPPYFLDVVAQTVPDLQRLRDLRLAARAIVVPRHLRHSLLFALMAAPTLERVLMVGAVGEDGLPLEDLSHAKNSAGMSVVQLGA